MRRSTTIVLTLATLSGGGTAVWTVASLDPVTVEVVDIRARLMLAVQESPDRIDSWTSVARYVLSMSDERGDTGPERAIEAWLLSVDPDWASASGAEAMLWYTVSHQLAERAAGDSGSSASNFNDPAAAAARQRAIDLLLRHSQSRPEAMRHWHWNSLAWAWARSGRFDRAVGAMHRTEESLLALPVGTAERVMSEGLTRALNCWGPQGVNDPASAAAYLVRVSEDVEERGASSPFASIGPVSLAQQMILFQPYITTVEAVATALRRLRAAPAEEDLRLEWLRASALIAQVRLDEEQAAALDGLESQLELFGESAENPRLTWNELGWRRRLSGDEGRALEAWGRWLEGRRRAADQSPTPENLYDLACGLALVGRGDEALDTLERAADAGWMNYPLTDRHRDLSSLAEHPRFRRLVARLREIYQAENRIPGDAR